MMSSFLQRSQRGMPVALVVALLLWLTVVAVQARAELPGRVGRVALVQGQAQFWESDQRMWVPLQINRLVTAGDRIRSEPQSRVDVQIGSLQVILGASTDADFPVLDDAFVQTRLRQGTLAVRIRFAPWSRELEIMTDEVRLQPQGAGLYRLDRDFADGGRTSVIPLRGALAVRGAESPVTFPLGQRTDLVMRGGRLQATYRPAENDAFGQFLLALDRTPDSPMAYSHASPEITGLDTLDRHGQWDMHPQVGAVWFPTQVPPGWEPYRHGRWVWVRPWGWTWMDDMPWGFAPSHYGRWLNWNGRWVWSPGAAHPRPAWSPAIGHWGNAHGSVHGVHSGATLIWRSGTPPPRQSWSPAPAPTVVVPHPPVHDRRDSHDRHDRFDPRDPRDGRDPREPREPREWRGDHEERLIRTPRWTSRPESPSVPSGPVFPATPAGVLQPPTPSGALSPPTPAGALPPAMGAPSPRLDRTPPTDRGNREDRNDRTNRPNRPRTAEQ